MQHHRKPHWNENYLIYISDFGTKLCVVILSYCIGSDDTNKMTLTKARI
jgi:hypothetical protein